LTETAKELQLNKTTAFRLLKTLENMEYIKKKDSYFELNREMFLASPVRKPPIDWTALKSPYRLGMSVGESVYIGTLDEEELVMQQMIKPPFEEPFTPEIGNRSPAHQSAIGKVILAHFNLNEQEDLFSRLALTPATDHTFVDEKLFFHHFDVIKKQGLAIDDEERFLGVRCIAAPVFRDNQIIAAIAIAGRSENLQRSLLQSLTRKVIKGSEEITNEIN